MSYSAGETLTYRLDDFERIANSPKSCRVVDAILLRMINEGASEVQFDFQPRDIRLSRCVNGEWVEPPSPSLNYRHEIIKRMREIAGLDPSNCQQTPKARVRLIAVDRAMDSEVLFQTADNGEISAIRLTFALGS